MTEEEEEEKAGTTKMNEMQCIEKQTTFGCWSLRYFIFFIAKEVSVSAFKGQREEIHCPERERTLITVN